MTYTSFKIGEAMVFGDNEFLVEYVYEKDLNNEENIQK